MDDGFGYWLSGFIDGEGCFTIAKGKGDGYYCRFTLHQRDDDRPIIEEIAHSTGIGRIYAQKVYQNSKPQVQWHVSTQADCLKLVEILDRYPMRSRKRADYDVWKEAVEFWTSTSGGHTSDPQRWEHLAQLRDHLRLARKY